jgi:diguanylate cyclase (GGDEF)-like protein
VKHTPRETAGVTTRLIVTYVRRHGGDEAVGEVLRRSEVGHRLDQLEDERFWCSYDDKIALFLAAGEVLRDPRIGRHIGESLFDEQVGSGLRLLIGSLGNPQQVLRSVSKANAKFSTSATMATVSTTSRHAVVTYRLHPPHRPHRVDCDYTQGILSQVSVLFGLPPADVAHPACQVDGSDECRYEISWSPRRFSDRFRVRANDLVTPYEADALREQLVDLQRTVADLVSTPDLDRLLHGIADRAGASVRGQRYLLAVELEGERAPRFHSEGFAPDVAEALGIALLTDQAGGSSQTRITSEVRSTQRRYGWLAAELPPGQGFLPGEQAQLDAYGRLAAAALDAATALEDARARGETAETLLRLGHELARAGDEVGIAERVSAAVPPVLGAARATVLLWDPDAELLRAVAVHGYGHEAERALRFTLSLGSTDEVEATQRGRTPRWLSRSHPEPFVRAALDEWNASVIVTAPIIVHGKLAGVLLALWDEPAPPTAPKDVLLQRLSALGDQASTAISAARSLGEARYQARHDALTGLGNRVLFTERIEQALADGRRSGRHPVVCFLDLDGFKAVNDAHGHAVGDQLLTQVGRRVLSCVRETDVVARLSGDEFGVLVRGLERSVEAEPVAAKLVQALATPFHLEGHTVRIGASIGVAAAPGDGTTPDALLIAADHAMYRAKRTGSTWRLASGELVGPTPV